MQGTVFIVDGKYSGSRRIISANVKAGFRYGGEYTFARFVRGLFLREITRDNRERSPVGNQRVCTDIRLPCRKQCLLSDGENVLSFQSDWFLHNPLLFLPVEVPE